MKILYCLPFLSILIFLTNISIGQESSSFIEAEMLVKQNKYEKALLKINAALKEAEFKL